MKIIPSLWAGKPRPYSFTPNSELRTPYFQVRRQEGKAYYLFQDTMAEILIFSLYYCINFCKLDLIFVTFYE